MCELSGMTQSQPKCVQSLFNRTHTDLVDSCSIMFESVTYIFRRTFLVWLTDFQYTHRNHRIIESNDWTHTVCNAHEYHQALKWNHTWGTYRNEIDEQGTACISFSSIYGYYDLQRHIYTHTRVAGARCVRILYDIYGHLGISFLFGGPVGDQNYIHIGKMKFRLWNWEWNGVCVSDNL